MENKRLNETYERPQAELIDLLPEGVLCDSTGTSGGEKWNDGGGTREW